MALPFACQSLAALIAAVALPPFGFYFLGNWPEAWVLVPIAVILFWRHRQTYGSSLPAKNAR